MSNSHLENRVALAIARAVRRRREELGMSQEELSLASGVNRTTVQDLEMGRSDHTSARPANPTTMTVLRIAKALDVSVEDLLGTAQAVFDAASEYEY